MPDEGDDLEGMTQQEYDDEMEATMDMMYPEGYDPDSDGSIFDDD